MKEIIKRNDFQSEKEEIYFFKKIKPQVYSELIFYHTLFKIETKRPKTKLLQEKYLNRVLKKLHKYFKLNEDVCQYYWSEKEYNDELYFLRKNRNIALPTNTLFSFIDHEFSTLHDHTYSCIMAHEQLIRYLENEIQKLQNQELKPELSETNYNWTTAPVLSITEKLTLKNWLSYLKNFSILTLKNTPGLLLISGCVKQDKQSFWII
jgi:hypothetical protein